MTKRLTPVHQWTKSEIKNLIDIWEDKTVKEVAEAMGLEHQQIVYMVAILRKNGFEMARKRIKGVNANLILELKKEYKIR